MAKLRIGVLYEFWWDEDESGMSEGRPKRKTPDDDVQEVYEALEEDRATTRCSCASTARTAEPARAGARPRPT